VQTTLESGLEGNWESQITPGKRGPFTDRDVRAYPIFGLPGDDDQPNREKQVLQVIIFAQDVSEKRRLQASLFRSANLAAVGQLASSIAHQINNPLTVIIANTQLMEMDTPPDSFNYPIITDILEAGAQIRQIVQNLLDFSTQDVYEWFETGVEDTLADALALVAHSLRKSHIEVVKQIDPLPTIIASASHLKLLWMNLLLNARDAISARLAENGGSKTEGIITIAAGRVSDQVQIQISDNGVGLAPQHRPMLFHPFFTTKTTGKNPGLGLYTCRAIIESHDGQIDIESNPAGAGAVVTVTLPIDKR
jgi:two-component system NtrC family sensor kinase